MLVKFTFLPKLPHLNRVSTGFFWLSGRFFRGKSRIIGSSSQAPNEGDGAPVGSFQFHTPRDSWDCPSGICAIDSMEMMGIEY